MFGFAKSLGGYKAEAVENVIGVGLQSREALMNYGDIAAKNIFSGYAITRVFAADKERLSFEFDAVYLHYLLLALSDIGVRETVIKDAIERVFDNFEVTQQEIDQFNKRLDDYESLGDEDVAERLVDNLDVTDFPDKYREPSRQTLGKQFKVLSKNVRRCVRDELGAS